MLRIDETSLINVLLEEITLTALSVESRQNDRSMSKQHIAILLGGTCFTRLVPVAPCCDMLGVVSSSFTIFKLELTTPSMSYHGTCAQHVASKNIAMC